MKQQQDNPQKNNAVIFFFTFQFGNVICNHEWIKNMTLFWGREHRQILYLQGPWI